MLRSSRYLDLALRQSQAKWPGADVAVVAPKGVLDSTLRRRVFDFSAGRFSPWTWWRSSTRTQVRAWKPDEVVVQLPSASTKGSANLGLAALLIAPHGFWFVLPDGELQFMPASRWLGELAFRGAKPALGMAAIAAVALGTIIAWPAYMVSRARLAWSRT